MCSLDIGKIRTWILVFCWNVTGGVHNIIAVLPLEGSALKFFLQRKLLVMETSGTDICLQNFGPWWSHLPSCASLTCTNRWFCLENIPSIFLTAEKEPASSIIFLFSFFSSFSLLLPWLSTFPYTFSFSFLPGFSAGNQTMALHEPGRNPTTQWKTQPCGHIYICLFVCLETWSYCVVLDVLELTI